MEQLLSKTKNFERLMRKLQAEMTYIACDTKNSLVAWSSSFTAAEKKINITQGEIKEASQKQENIGNSLKGSEQHIRNIWNELKQKTIKFSEILTTINVKLMQDQDKEIIGNDFSDFWNIDRETNNAQRLLPKLDSTRKIPNTVLRMTKQK